MGFLTPDTIIDRVVLLLETYLNSEIDNIDTTNNAIAGAGVANNFATPTIPASHVQAYVDRLPGAQIRVIVTDEGSRNARDFQIYGLADGASEPDSTLPRLDRNTRIGITVRVAAMGGAETTAGATDIDTARRICNRVAEGVAVLMYRYPRLSVPSLSKSVLTAGIEIVNDSRANAVQEDEWQFYERTLTYDVRTIEGRG